MVKVKIYFDYAENRSSSRMGTGEPMSAEEIGDIKWRVERFGDELGLDIPESDTLTVLSKSVGERVAAYGISSSLGVDDLKARIAQTAQELKLTAPDLRYG